MKLLQQIFQNSVFKIASLNSFSVLIKICAGIVSAKILAVFVGPSGMALVGNMRNFVSFTENVSTLGFQNGIIRFIASHKDDQEKVKSFITTVLLLLLGVALLLSFLLYFLADYWGSWLFEKNSTYILVIKVFAFTLPWQSLSIFFLTVLNGLGKYKKVIYTNIAGHILGLVLTVILVTQLYTLGALLSLILSPTLLLPVTLFYLNKELSVFKGINPKLFNIKLLGHLYSFTVMSLFTAIVSPLVFLILRNHLIDVSGLAEAGYWETMSRISTYYIMFISTLLTVYFLPQLSQSQSKQETSGIFRNYYKTIIPSFVLLLILLYLGRYYIVKILFSKDFMPVADLFVWQLAGDVLKAASLILGYEFFAKKLVKAFLITEAMSFIVLFISGWFLSEIFGAEGMVMAHFITYAVYLIVLAIYFRKTISSSTA
ncbi:MAG: O-antigen translocase [Flavobacteriaceae bacterium]|nr:O-antigen translocase [Flavobacteriaceae bacterium]